jgi:O-antigen/teichoic acid export membrane protein
VYYNLSAWFKLTDKTYYGTLITAGGAGITILANYILIPRMGYLGSSWATFLCYGSMTVACYLLGQRFYPIPYQVGKSLLYIVVTTALAYGVNAITWTNPWISSGFHATVFVVYLFAIYLVEKDAFKQAST